MLFVTTGPKSLLNWALVALTSSSTAPRLGEVLIPLQKGYEAAPLRQLIAIHSYVIGPTTSDHWHVQN